MRNLWYNVIRHIYSLESIDDIFKVRGAYVVLASLYIFLCEKSHRTTLEQKLYEVLDEMLKDHYVFLKSIRRDTC